MIRSRLYKILETGSDSDVPSRWFDYFILTLILLNALAVVMGTSPAAREYVGRGFDYFEHFSMAVFTLEYVLRVWTCVERGRYRSPVMGRIKFMLTPLQIIDALAVFPLFVGPDLRFVRLFRVFRLIRVFKLTRYSKASAVIVRILRAKRDELVLAASIMLTALVMASCLMYYVENEANPDKFASIPATMWWSVATLTTVGYGDVVPITTLGRVLGAVISLLGIGFFALPAGILASGFSHVMSGESPQGICPRCGAQLLPGAYDADDETAETT
jgi:voltage-gated potassium channel